VITLTQTLLIIVIVVLTVVLTAIGIQFFLLIKEARQAVKHANSIMDNAQDLVSKLSHPAASFNNLLTGLKEGVNVVETIAGIFSRRQDKTNDIPYEEFH
jgi:flagellar basal body-associated protein FliL